MGGMLKRGASSKDHPARVAEEPVTQVSNVMKLEKIALSFAEAYHCQLRWRQYHADATKPSDSRQAEEEEILHNESP